MTSTSARQQTHERWVPAADSFGARLALLRQRMGWGNVKEAAEACGLPVESWRGWERDNRDPRNLVGIARTIEAATGVDPIWLMTGRSAQEEAVVDTPGKRRMRGQTETFSCRSRGIRTRLHRPDRMPAGAI